MEHVMRISEMQSGAAVSEKKKEAMGLAASAKRSFAAGDMEKAAQSWCAIYDLYEGKPSPENSVELMSVMAEFTDDEVFGITDWMKNNGTR